MNIAAIYPIKPRYRDPNVSLIMDGEVVFAYEEEKLSRRQKEFTSQGYPIIGLHAALKKARLRPDQIDLWALVGRTDDVISDFTTILKHTDFIHFVPELKINRVPHRLAYAALAVFTAPFEECLFISMGGGGYGRATAVLGAFRHNLFQEIHRSNGAHLSDFWSDMTHYLGFKQFEEEKLMGLAAYGHADEKLYRQFRSIISITDDGFGIFYRQPKRTVRHDLDFFNWHHFRLFNTTYSQFDFSSVPYIREVSKPDIAATVQKLTEDYVADIVARLVRKTGLRQVAVSGGLFHNSKLNGLLPQLPNVDAVHVPMATGDDGLSLGAGLYTHWEKAGKRCARVPLSPYLGPSFDNETIQRDIESFGLKHRHSENAHREAAHLIAGGAVVGWFQEAGEYGPRSLGARSVLADPRNPLVKERINRLLGNPDRFAPHALSIMEEYVDEFFDYSCKSPYMNMAFRAREEKARLVPAAMHGDGMIMQQTVGKSLNKRFYRLIEEFEKLTGLPAVLNAGFNRYGLPVVCTPIQALEHLSIGCVDVLVIGDYVVEREFLPKEESKDSGAESHLVAAFRAMPVVNLALEGKTKKALEVCCRMGIPGNNGIEAMIHALSDEPEKKELAEMLVEHLTDLIEALGPQKNRR
jgi:carbamoyltransferase